MRAMVASAPGIPLRLEERATPIPGPDQVLVRVGACAVCRTDRHLVDGELPAARFPVVPGHQIAGTVLSVGERVTDLEPGRRVGVSWLGGACGRCRQCVRGRENLCDAAVFTGCAIDGGYAELCVADARFCIPLPEGYTDDEIAPLLCAGPIGYRALAMTGDAERIGFYGFGAAARLLVQVTRHQGRRVYAFTRPGKPVEAERARALGAAWAGGSDQPPPEPLDAAILFAAVGELVPRALAAVAKGGIVVCAEIHMSDVPSFPYALLWGERVLRSVANLTRRDATEFLALAPSVPVRAETTRFALPRAQEALDELARGELRGTAVLIP